MGNRRNFLRAAFGLGAGVASARGADKIKRQTPVGAPVRVQSPDLNDLPFTVDNDVKVFHLVAEPVKQVIAPNKTIDVWGFNGSAPGPTIQVNQGDRVRIVFENHLPEATSMHWHGFEIPHNMDGGPGISQDPVNPGGRFIYEFTLHQAGTYFYHSHMAMQEMFGMLGAFIMHPKDDYTPKVDQDFVLLFQEYSVLPNNSVPNTSNMEFNWLVINGKSAPATTPLVVRLGDRVRIRMINLGMDHHPIHLHGHTFYTTGTEGGRIPEAAWIPGNTVLLGVAQSRDVEFVAANPGAWMIHCHLPHHMMNQMSSNTNLNRGPISERTVGNTPLSPDKAKEAMQMGDMDMANIAKNATQVPGFPQDGYMESAMMAMDDKVVRPQNAGLPKGWSGFMQGMMSFLRVLPSDEYESLMKGGGQ